MNNTDMVREQIAERYYKSLFKGELYKYETEKSCLKFADKILNLLTASGWVEQDPDQSLPDKLHIKFKALPGLTMPAQKELGETVFMVYEQAQQDMLKAGFVKVTGGGK